MSPSNTGLTNSLTIDSQFEYYGNQQLLTQTTIIHQSFLLAPVTGDFDFEMGVTDDTTVIWLGPNAYSGWTKANADTVRDYIPPSQQDVTHIYRRLEAGTYYPVRVAFTDFGGGAALNVRIYGPDGTEYTGTDGGYFRTEACDGSYAAFPGYG